MSPMLCSHARLSTLSEAVYEPLPSATDDDGVSFKFRWNSRVCTGNHLHKAVLAGAIAETSRMLDEQDNILHERFTYTTEFKGQIQEGSGEAIHLAVTRSNLEVVRLLLHRRAELQSMVTRAGKGHYDVLHAAVFSEGVGGSPKMIQFLLKLKAAPIKNLDGRYPLHMAYQAGAKDLIPILQQDMQHYGLLDAVCAVNPTNKKTPLQVGIEAGKLTQEELAQVALLTPTSLKVFLRFEPRSIPAFFERWERQSGENLRGSALAEHVTVMDLCSCLREHPHAAMVLLDKLTDKPEVDNPGWHPLPTRMDFGPRSTLDVFRDKFNPERTLIGTYQRSSRWEFDAINFNPPKWHIDVISGKYGQTHDVLINVCHLPDILCAEFLAALEVTDENIFDTDIVKSCLNVVWWGGAYKLDILQLLITVMGLVLLIVERAQFGLDNDTADDHAAARGLFVRGSDQTSLFINQTDPSDAGDFMNKVFEPTLADEFIGARGFVDFFHELVQLAGFVVLGAWRDYVNAGNLYDLFRAALAIVFYWCRQSQEVQVLLTLIYWFRLLEVSFSENLMRELLPVTRLAKGLLPSSIVCLIAVCAVSHARWLVHTSDALWPNIFRDTFLLLITAAIPNPHEAGTFGLIFAYLSVMSFTVFFLNIFIGVIGDLYSNEKAQSSISFQVKKCGMCFAFLVRARVLPCRVMSSACATAVMVLGIAGLAVFVLVCILDDSLISAWPLTAVIWLVLCQFMAMWATYQDPEAAWTRIPTAAGQEPVKRYMWLCTVSNSEPEAQMDGIERLLQSVQDKVKDLQSALVAKGRDGRAAGPARDL